MEIETLIHIGVSSTVLECPVCRRESLIFYDMQLKNKTVYFSEMISEFDYEIEI